MNDDIVTRLRAQMSNEFSIEHPHMVRVATLYEQAADEIERLNKLVTTWVICAERLVESNEGEAYKKAMDFYRDCQRIAKETCHLFGGATTGQQAAWRRVAKRMYEKANPAGTSVCDCDACQEYKYLAEGNIEMGATENVQTKYQYFWDRQDYWVVKAGSDGCLNKTGASFVSKEEAKRYTEWLNKQEVC